MKRDVPLASPQQNNFVVVLGTSNILENIFILHQIHFQTNKIKLNFLFRNLYIFSPPDFFYGELPIMCYFLLVLCSYCKSANRFLFLMTESLYNSAKD